MNSKRSFEDKWNFCKDLSTRIELQPEWVSGFTDAEGNFNFVFRKTGNSTVCAFSIYQNIHDYPIMAFFIKFFGGGKLYPLNMDGTFSSAQNYFNEREKKGLNSIITFQVNNTNLNKNTIIPFFDKYPLITTKNLDFLDWKKLINLASIQHYKTIEGRNEMINITKNMNSRRDINSSNFQFETKILNND